MERYENLIFIVLFAISFVGDITHKYTHNKCVLTTKVVALLFIHHIINNFLNFGWLFSNRKLLVLYILTVIGVYIQFALNDHKCVLTQLENKLCNYRKYELFNDIFKMLGIKKGAGIYFIHGLRLTGVLIAIYKLNK